MKDLNNFAMTIQLIEHDLDKIEADHVLDLQRKHRRVLDQDETYYPQIELDIRAEAAAMAPHYQTFYSLEKTIRRLITDTLADPLIEKGGANWWTGTRVPNPIQAQAEERRKKEIDSGVTPRSDDPIDFCTFGELGEIIKVNWDVFGAIFSSVKAVERVMSSLNMLRGPIAHCNQLAEDEVVRLRLAVRDWFRLME